MKNTQLIVAYLPTNYSQALRFMGSDGVLLKEVDSKGKIVREEMLLARNDGTYEILDLCSIIVDLEGGLSIDYYNKRKDHFRNTLWILRFLSEIFNTCLTKINCGSYHWMTLALGILAMYEIKDSGISPLGVMVEAVPLVGADWYQAICKLRDSMKNQKQWEDLILTIHDENYLNLANEITAEYWNILITPKDIKVIDDDVYNDVY